MNVLVTGATGALGRRLVPKLREAGYAVRVMSRRFVEEPDRVRADLGTGQGLAEAVEGMDVVVHCASAPMQPWHYAPVDVHGTRRLLEAAATAQVSHVVYPSIVGMEGVPHPYFKPKLKAEELQGAGTVPWSIARGTQFYTLFDQMIGFAARFPILALPSNWTIQPIDPAEFADELVAVVRSGPVGRTADIGGPAVRTLGDMTESWVMHRGAERRVRSLRLPGRLSKAFRSGEMTCPGHEVGVTSWEAWLEGQTDPIRVTA